MRAQSYGTPSQSSENSTNVHSVLVAIASSVPNDYSIIDSESNPSETGSVLVDWAKNDDDNDESAETIGAENLDRHHRSFVNNNRLTAESGSRARTRVTDRDDDHYETSGDPNIRPSSIKSFSRTTSNNNSTNNNSRAASLRSRSSNTNMSLYDSDSSEELRDIRNRKRSQVKKQQQKKHSTTTSSSLFDTIRHFTESLGGNSTQGLDDRDPDLQYRGPPLDDDDVSSAEHCMILTDDEEEEEIDEEDVHTHGNDGFRSGAGDAATAARSRDPLTIDNVQRQQAALETTLVAEVAVATPPPPPPPTTTVEKHTKRRGGIGLPPAGAATGKRRDRHEDTPLEDNNNLRDSSHTNNNNNNNTSAFKGVMDTGSSPRSNQKARAQKGEAAPTGLTPEEHGWRRKSSPKQFEIPMDDALAARQQQQLQQKDKYGTNRTFLSREPSQDSDVDLGRKLLINIPTAPAEDDADMQNSDDEDDNDNEGSHGSSSRHITTDDDNDSDTQASSLSGLDDDNDNDNDRNYSDADNNYKLEPSVRQAQHFATASFPVSFINPSANTQSSYVDSSLIKEGVSQKAAGRFATEHRILLRAILQLLFERDHVGVEDDVDNPDNIMKKGPLKKHGHGMGVNIRSNANWKVKYVEIRGGSFSYYEDNHNTANGGGRKIISLRASNCICVPRNDHSPIGRVLELSQEGGPKRLWMANSEDERKAWITSIKKAMVGCGERNEDVTTFGGNDREAELSLDVQVNLHRDAIDKYRLAQIGIQESWNRKEYVSCLSFLFGNSLRLPAKWIREEVSAEVTHPNGGIRHKRKNDMTKLVRSRVNDFLKNVSRDTVSINGHLVRGDSPHGPERIVGALSRCILEYDRLSSESGTMTELQAIQHARDMLLVFHESRTKDEAHVAIVHMTSNQDLVICLPSTSHKQTPIRIHVLSAAEDDDNGGLQKDDMSGWVTTRSRSHKNWKNRYCVVSEGILSYYEHGTPRPHGLRGQLILAGATLNQISLGGANKNLLILRIATKDGERERQICFKSNQDFWLWRDTFQRAIDLCASSEKAYDQENGEIPRHQKNKHMGGSKLIKGASEGRGKIMKGAADLFMFRGMRGGAQPATSQLSSSKLVDTISPSDSKEGTGKQEPTVHVLVESSSVYKIVTSNPTGNEEKDTLAMIRANFLQSFLLSGGDQGRLSQGNDLLELEFLKGCAKDGMFELMFPFAEKDYGY